MSKEKKLFIRIPQFSQYELAQMLYPITTKHKNTKIKVPENREGFNADSATVAIIISSGTLLAIQLIKSLTEIYIQYRKEKYKNVTDETPMNINIELVVGDSVDLSIKKNSELSKLEDNENLKIENISKINLE